MRVYLIKHLPTGLWMPKLERGATRWEPTIPKDAPYPLKHLACSAQWSAPPRIFHRLVNAKNARRWWLAGCFVNDPEEGFPTLEAAYRAKQRPPRIESEIEIVSGVIKSTFSGVAL